MRLNFLVVRCEEARQVNQLPRKISCNLAAVIDCHFQHHNVDEFDCELRGGNISGIAALPATASIPTYPTSALRHQVSRRPKTRPCGMVGESNLGDEVLPPIEIFVQ
jgi:hypothetical protein